MSSYNVERTESLTHVHFEVSDCYTHTNYTYIPYAYYLVDANA